MNKLYKLFKMLNLLKQSKLGRFVLARTLSAEYISSNYSGYIYQFLGEPVGNLLLEAMSDFEKEEGTTIGNYLIKGDDQKIYEIFELITEEEECRNS